jgi:hypothetical protein
MKGCKEERTTEKDRKNRNEKKGKKGGEMKGIFAWRTPSQGVGGGAENVGEMH